MFGVNVVVNEYVVQTFGSRTLPSEAYFYWLRVPNVWRKMAGGKKSVVNIPRTTKIRKIGDLPDFLYIKMSYFSVYYGAG